MTKQVGSPSESSTEPSMVLKTCVERFLVPWEGTGPMTADKKSFIAYKDVVGVLTISWGMTFHPDGTKIQEGEVWSWDYAVEAKSKILTSFYLGMIKLAPNLVNEPVARQAAVLSWCYNLGLGAFRASTFRKRILESNWQDAEVECNKWIRAQGQVFRGLVLRRKAEGIAIREGK